MERTRERSSTFLRNCNIVTAVSIIAAGYGFVEALRYHNSPENQEYLAFSNSVTSFQDQLVKEQSLASVGWHYEIRKPSDPRIERWGSLKNQLDQRRIERKQSFDNSPGEVFKYCSLIAGVLGVLTSRLANSAHKNAYPI